MLNKLYDIFVSICFTLHYIKDDYIIDTIKRMLRDKYSVHLAKYDSCRKTWISGKSFCK